jgi:hypothetical protein
MSEGVAGFICLCYLIFAAWLEIRRRRQEGPEEEEAPEPINALRLEGEVEALHRKMQKLRQLDEMIIDLRLCRPAAVQKAFRMEWMSAAGQNHTFDFFADGENLSTAYLLELAIAERAEVNQEIQQRIYDLYRRTCYEDFCAAADPEKYMTV